MMLDIKTHGDRITKGEQFFESGLNIFVNRVSESFGLLEHSHDFVEISYVREGIGTHYIDGQTIAVKKGDLFYIPLGISHIFRPASSSPKNKLIVINCIFNEQLLDLFIKDLIGYYQYIPKSDWWSGVNTWKKFKEDGHEFGRIMDLMHQEFNRKVEGYKVVLHALLVQLFILLERELDPAKPIHLLDHRLEIALNFISGHLHESLTLTKVSHQTNVGERQLQRLFQRILGQSFTQWIQDQRIKRSCELLKQTKLTLTEIILSVGFQDLKHFHRLFKSKIGITPGQYRKQ
jgi:AraC-like DNA-binding protein